MGLSARHILGFAGVVVFTLLLAPEPATAASEARNCPTEPTQDVPIASGNVYSGPNCAIGIATDLDTFQFSGNKNDVYRIAVSLDGEPYPKNICMDLYDPSGAKMFTGCSDTITAFPLP